MKKNSDYWLKQYEQDEPSFAGLLDPDGWDRSNFNESWNELITYKEFRKRMMYSTVMTDTKKLNLKKSCK